MRRYACLLLVFFSILMSPAAPAATWRMDFQPPPDPDDGQTFRILCLHDVRDGLRASFADFPDAFAIETRGLVDAFEWLRANDYHPISLDDVVQSRSGGKPLPPRAVLLTFDDGFASNYTHVFPLLKQFGYPAVFALVTSWVDLPADQPIALSAKLTVPRNTFLNWDQVREMAASPLVEFISHTHDLHRGVLSNPQGNERPAASTRIYDPVTRTYETDEEHRARVRADLAHSARLIAEHAGRAPRAIAWPYGAQNRDTDAAAAELGMGIMFTLRTGPNTPDLPLSQLRRSLVDYQFDVAKLQAALREPVWTEIEPAPVQRVVQVDLDYIYDPDPAQEDRNLSALIDRIRDLEPSAVYVQAFADPLGDGDIRSVYFPNRHMPMRADLFNRVSWQLRTRAEVSVYAWMPVLTFTLPEGHPVAGRTVQSVSRGPGERGVGSPTRLSPFDPQVREVIDEIYEDLAKNAWFEGILFHDDAVLDDTEDASPGALKVYESWGLPPDVQAIRASPELHDRWVRAKTRYLIDFTQEITRTVEGYQRGEVMRKARNLFAMPVMDPATERDFSQNLQDFLDSYDYVALMAMPRMENAEDPKRWLRMLVNNVRAADGLDRTIFELQSRDWRTGENVDSREMLTQMQQLRSLGAVHYGYYPDDFIGDHPNIEVLRPAMSLMGTLKVRRLSPQQNESREQALQALRR
ncbi:poly-beta-1,6-N-acetyl-D-glucosamine N-deacetylase PgaB [Verticiella sediminum]|uniref:Poly-beta-1,6-N-acetyl-D-glucosamine N-deacetylase PgaB n=1 Tax=Verticiella sediminum TaxID=1247510 RepID=A0A556AYB6_9BURK|nr:poly-beta-1,6-N-acetyl-D-glucosamine N-deacetylase PgaB [Verticiella sediminum]TSH97908.1 poly-beta-1,6-N-acetyl-D-glucosamine N-deacetylase PgaB [Verticiella sediminum]